MRLERGAALIHADGVLERDVAAFELGDDLLELGERLLEAHRGKVWHTAHRTQQYEQPRREAIPRRPDVDQVVGFFGATWTLINGSGSPAASSCLPSPWSSSAAHAP